MKKTYIVRLNDTERQICLDTIKKLKGSSTKVRRSQILLKADANGPNWTDKKIAEAFSCTRQCVENLRQRLVTTGFEIALNGQKRESPPRPKLLDGKQEAQIIAMQSEWITNTRGRAWRTFSCCRSHWAVGDV